MPAPRLPSIACLLLFVCLAACDGVSASSQANASNTSGPSFGPAVVARGQSAKLSFTPDCSFPAGAFTPESCWRVTYKPGSAWTNLAPWAFWAVSAARPGVLVELGSHNGYSTFAFAQAIRDLDLPTRAYAVDTWEGDVQAGFYDDSVYQSVVARTQAEYASNLTLLRMTFDSALGRIEDGSVDLLHIDGQHHYDNVKHDFDTWLPKMSARGVVLFHDIDILDNDFGVYRFWAELTAIYPSFAFHQGPGLGILGVGSDLPAAFANLFAARDTPKAACVQRIYEHLGSAAETWQPPAG